MSNPHKIVVVRKAILAFGISFGILGSGVAMAATDLSVPTNRTDMFRNGSSSSLSVFLEPVGTAGTSYLLKHKVNLDTVDQSIPWIVSGLPQNGISFPNFTYKVLATNHVGLQENALAGYKPQCVAFVKLMSGNTTQSKKWIRGTKVTSLTSSSGLINKAIAVFLVAPVAPSTNWTYDGDAQYGDSHTAVVLSAEFASTGKVNAVWVADQNFNRPQDGKIRKHKITVGGTGVMNLDNYYIVQTP